MAGVIVAAVGSSMNVPSLYKTHSQKTTNYTLALTDIDTCLDVNSSSSVAITIPPASSVAWVTNSSFEICATGTGQVSVAAGAGVTIQTPTTLIIAQRFCKIVVENISTDVWRVGPVQAIQPLQVVQATRLKDFIGKLGVCTSCRQYIAPDIDVTTLATNLAYVGASAIRDTLPATLGDDAFVLPYWQYVVNAGIKLCMSTVGNNETLDVTYLVGQLQLVAQLGTDCLLFIEQTNEPNNNTPTYNSSKVTATGSPGFLPVAQFSSAYYKACKANAFLAKVPVVAISQAGAEPDNSGLQWLAIPANYNATTLVTNASTASGNNTLHFASTTGRKVGEYIYGTNVATNATIASLTSTTIVMSAVSTGIIASAASIKFGAGMPEGTIFADVQNLHFYPMFGGVSACSQSIDPVLGDVIDITYLNNVSTTNIGGFSGATPTAARAARKIVTEFGYEQVGATAGGTPLTPIIAARNILTGWLNVWSEGYEWLFLYRIYDEGPTSGYFGLYAYDKTPRLAATYLHNFTTILADTSALASSFSADQLGYKITNLPSTGKSALFQRADGTFFLVLWNNVTNWTISTGVAITISGTTVTATFERQGTISTYDPTVGTSASATTIGNTVSVSLTDYPLIISFV